MPPGTRGAGIPQGPAGAHDLVLDLQARLAQERLPGLLLPVEDLAHHAG